MVFGFCLIFPFFYRFNNRSIFSTSNTFSLEDDERKISVCLANVESLERSKRKAITKYLSLTPNACRK